jgi:hypothetical protein
MDDHSADVAPPICKKCALATIRVGKLPRMGSRPELYVYKCDPCKTITTIEEYHR